MNEALRHQPVRFPIKVEGREGLFRHRAWSRRDALGLMSDLRVVRGRRLLGALRAASCVWRAAGGALRSALGALVRLQSGRLAVVMEQNPMCMGLLIIIKFRITEIKFRIIKFTLQIR